MFQYLPTEFCQLKNLERLDLNSTDLKWLPREIDQLEHLFTLDISYNVLERPLPYNAIEKWFERGVYFEQEETNYDLIMRISGINLFETEITDFSKKILLTNNLEKISNYYNLLELI